MIFYCGLMVHITDTRAQNVFYNVIFKESKMQASFVCKPFREVFATCIERATLFR